ncbi:MAG: glycoside hydrolase family 78 protein [Armatimonadetes bacterium]|nr:glycoside hydrolase family 78 protein [Armatimonadota bacterium]
MNLFIVARSFLLTLFLVFLQSSISHASMKPADLKCESLRNPLGIDAPNPRLSWSYNADLRKRGQRQTAYQILVASRPEILQKNKGDFWDSGRVASRHSLGIAYKGLRLNSGHRFYWKVRAWDGEGKASRYSDPAWFEMGLWEPGDWQALWIRRDTPPITNEADFYKEHPAPLLRKEVSLAKPVKRARAYVTGLGYYELRINGEKVGDRVLDPAWTDTLDRVFYSTYDVTDHLKRGPNALGIMLGNGWYNPLPLRMFGRFNLRQYLPVGPPRAILQLEVEYEGEGREVIVTDETWKTGDGPILKNNVYLGEVVDARKMPEGWDRPGFNDRGWTNAVLPKEEVGRLQAQPLPPIRVTETLRPVKLTEPTSGTHIFDMGENFAGWITLRMNGKSGDRVTLRFGELLNADGTLNVMTSVAGQIKGNNGGPGAPPVAWQSDTYILKGGGEESYTPRFTWHGFRYVEVTGYPGRPTLGSLDGHRLQSDVEPAGVFSCSNLLFNRIQEITLRTQRSNIFSVQSDCPHRERFGYGGDIVAASEMAIYNFDMAAFYAKTVQDFADAARPNGGITEIAPHVGIADQGLGGESGPVAWGTAFALLQWQLYQYYGDRQILEAQYPAVKRYVAFLRSAAKDHYIEHDISDHESLAEKPVALSATAFYYYNVALAGKIARVLNQSEDAKKFESLAGEIEAAINRRFLHPGTGRYDTGTQAAQAFALYMDLVPQEERAKALEVLVKDVEAHDGHLTTGIFGTKYLLRVLTDMGRADLAYRIVNQKTFPGWGYMIERGATTLWETWKYDDRIYSHNHPMFGSVSEWFYAALAGIRHAPDAAGFAPVVIRPEVVGDLTWVKGRYDSARGPLISEWTRKGNELTLRVEIPANVDATIYVPTSDPDSVTEGGTSAGQSKGVEAIGTESGAAAYRVGSGQYRFRSRL